MVDLSLYFSPSPVARSGGESGKAALPAGRPYSLDRPTSDRTGHVEPQPVQPGYPSVSGDRQSKSDRFHLINWADECRPSRQEPMRMSTPGFRSGDQYRSISPISFATNTSMMMGSAGSGAVGDLDSFVSSPRSDGIPTNSIGDGLLEDVGRMTGSAEDQLVRSGELMETILGSMKKERTGREEGGPLVFHPLPTPSMPYSSNLGLYYQQPYPPYPVDVPPQPYYDSAPTSPTQKRCGNCGTSSTPSWRRCPEGKELLCNACGLYVKLHGRPRPFKLAEDGSVRVIRCSTAQPDPQAYPYSYAQYWACENCGCPGATCRSSKGPFLCQTCSSFLVTSAGPARCRQPQTRPPASPKKELNNHVDTLFLASLVSGDNGGL